MKKTGNSLTSNYDIFVKKNMNSWNSLSSYWSDDKSRELEQKYLNDIKKEISDIRLRAVAAEEKISKILCQVNKIKIGGKKNGTNSNNGRYRRT